MALMAKTILWVDDEAELLAPHRLLLGEKGYHVETATNADDALELLRRRPYDLVLLDEQMPGTRGLDAYKDIREMQPSLPVVMVTKSEEDATLKEAIGANIRDYLVKPVTPRQVLTVITRILEGPLIRSQALARAFVERFRAIEAERYAGLDWRGWIERFAELMQWDVDLAAAGELGLHESLRGLYPDMHREFATFMRTEYPRWLRELDGDRPPLSVDVVTEFVMPVLARDRKAIFVVIDCLRVDQWRVLEPLLAPLYDVETTHYYSILPTATPYARNALFSGLFPAEIAARFPDWWGEKDDDTLNLHERDLLVAHLAELKVQAPVRYHKITTTADSDDLERHLPGAMKLRCGPLPNSGLSGRRCSRCCRRRRAGTSPWSSPAIMARCIAIRRPRCSPSATPPPTCATSLVRICAPNVRSRRSCLPTLMTCGCPIGRQVPIRSWPLVTPFLCIPRSFANTRAGIAAPSCTAALRPRSAFCRWRC